MLVSRPDVTAALLDIYRLLATRYERETWHWDPGYVQSPVEILVGSILVQHTTWTNAARALEALRAANALEMPEILRLPEDVLAALVRVSGTPVVKARRLRALAQTVKAHGGFDAFLALPTGALRAALLATHGVGPETADAIMLYAASRRRFVIDAYTRRVFTRLGLGPNANTYADWQRYFEDALLGPGDATMFQRYHAYIVLHGKAVCRPTPVCAVCPLARRCQFGASLQLASA